MLQSQHSSQICETVDQVIDYFLKNQENSKLFTNSLPQEKTKQFSDILKSIKISPKNYKLKTFIHDLSFLIQSYLSIDNILDNPSDIQLIPYIVCSLFYEMSDFKNLPSNAESKPKLEFSFTQKTKLNNYLNFLLDLISEDPELLDTLTNSNATEIIESLRKILLTLIEITEKYEISAVVDYLKDVMNNIMRALKIFLCEKNLLIVNKMIKNDNMDKIFVLFSNDFTGKSSLEILTLMVKYGSIDPNFQNFMNEKKVLKTLAGINKNIMFLLAFLDLNFYFEFPNFNKSDLSEIQAEMKKQLCDLSEEKGQEIINKIYQFSFCDFNLQDHAERKKNAIFNLQKENQDKYIRQNYMEKIIITPSFIEVLITYYEVLSKNNPNSFLKFEILHKILDLFDISIKNFFIIESEFKMIRRLIESLLVIDSETSHILLKIINYVVTFIFPENKLNFLSEEFIHLSVVLSKCKDFEVLFQTFDLIRDFLNLNRPKFQIFLRETEVYSGILSQFFGFFKEGNELNEDLNKRKYEKISEVLKLCLRGNDENFRIFENFNPFQLMINKNEGDFFNDLIIFFLEEQAKRAILEPYLVILLKNFNDQSFPEKIQISEYFFQLIIDKREKNDIFRDAILKKYKFAHKYIELISNFDENNEVFEQNLSLFFEKLKKYLISDYYFLKYFSKKNLFMLMFKDIKVSIEKKPANIHKTIVMYLFNLAIKDALLFNCKEIENLEEGYHFIRIPKTSTPIILFPEIMSFLFEYLVKICDVQLQMNILEEINSILKVSAFNRKILSQANFLESLGIIFHKEIKTSLHPFYELLLEILLKMIYSAPKFQDISLIETILMTINQEITDLTQKRNVEIQDKFIEQIDITINEKFFNPHHLILTNSASILSIKSVWFPQLSDQTLAKIEETRTKNQGFTFSIWFKSNYEISSTKRFNFFHVKSFLEEKHSVSMYLEKGHFHLKFLDNNPISLANLILNDETWYQLTISFIIQSPSLTEFELFLNGISIENRILNSNIGFNSEIFSQNSQLFIGYEMSSNYSSPIIDKQEISEYFEMGPIRLFFKALTVNEVNLLFSIVNYCGLVNYFTDVHSINWPLITLSNLRFFDFVQNRKDMKSQIAYTKLQISAKILYLTQFLAIECDPRNLISTKKKDFFQNNLKSHFLKNNFKNQNFVKSNFMTFILNVANDHFATQCYLLSNHQENEGHFIVYKNFLKKTIFFTDNFVYLIEKSNFVFTLFELLEKTQEYSFFFKIYKILMNLLEKSEFFAERFESENLWKVFLEILKKRSDFFQKEMLEHLLSLFCKKINFLNKNPLSSSLHPHLSNQSYYWLVNSLKIGKGILMDQDFQSFLIRTKSSLRMDFFEIIYFGLIDVNRNIFSNFNKHALRNSELVEFLLDNLITDSSMTLDSKIFELIGNLIKQTTFLEFDHEILRKVYEFALISFFPCYKKIEHITKASRRRHLESVDIPDNKLCLTSRKTSDQFEFGNMTTSNRNTKKLTVSANYPFIQNLNVQQINLTSFSLIHKFENAVNLNNLKRFDVLQIKLIDFLIKLHEFPQTFVPVKLILNIFQAKYLIQTTSTSDHKKPIISLCKLFGLSLINNDNRKTLVAYEDLPTILKPYCNEPSLYSYLLMGLKRKIKYDTSEIEKFLEKDENLSPNYFRMEDISLMTHLMNFIKNSLKNLKFLINTVQNEENLPEISQIFNRSTERFQDKRLSLLSAPHKSSFYGDSMMENDLKFDEIKEKTEDSITPDFLKVQNKHMFSTSIEDISYPIEKINLPIPMERKTTPFSLNQLLEHQNDRPQELPLEDTKNNESPLMTESKNDESLKESPLMNTVATDPLLKIYNISPTRNPSTNTMKNSLLKSRTPNNLPINKKKVNISNQGEIDLNTQMICKQKLIEILINENISNEPPILIKNLLKYFNEMNESQNQEGYLSLPNYANACKCFEIIMQNFMSNKSLITRKLSENLLMNVIDILQSQMEISLLLSAENINISANFINFLGFCLCEVLSNEITIENEINFLNFSKYSKLLMENYPNDKFFEILKIVLETLIEKIDENNLLDYCKTLKKTYIFIFSKLSTFGLSLQINISWFGNNLLTLLKKFFYFNKIQKEPKTPSSFKSFFNRIVLGQSDKSPMVRSELYDKMNKKDKSIINDFKGEMQVLLRKYILFELNRSIELFEENNEEELIVSRLNEYEENEKIIFDEEFENLEFYHCFLCLFGQMIESKNKSICLESILLLSYLPYHISKDTFKKMFIINECNVFDKCFDMLYSIKNNHSEESIKKAKSPWDFFTVLNYMENKKKFDVICQKKYLISWISFVNANLKTDPLKIKDQKNSNDFNSFIQEGGSSSKEDEKKMSIQPQTPSTKELSHEKLKRTKTLSEKSKDIIPLRISDLSEIDHFFQINSTNLSNTNPFMNFYISTLDKYCKDYLLRRLVQKLEKDTEEHSYNNYLNARLYGFFYENNPYLDKALKHQKKELRFTLNKKTGLFNQRSIVMNKITKSRNEEKNEDRDLAPSPTRRCSMIKKTSGVEYLKMPENFNSITMQEMENMPEYINSESNIDDPIEPKEEFLMLESEIDVEENEDYVFIFNEYEGNSKIYKESLHKLKKILFITESIESFYPITYLKKFGFLTAILIISKKNIYILKNWSFDEKQGIYDLVETTTNQFQEKDKSLLITKGTNIQPLVPLRKTTYLEESTIMENPLDLSKYGLLPSSEFDFVGNSFKENNEPIRIPVEKIVEINSKRFLLAHCAIEILTTRKSFFLIVGKEKREKIYEDIKKLFPQKVMKNQLSKENFLFTMVYKANPFLIETDNVNYQFFQTLDSLNILKNALPLWQDGTLNNFDYLMLLNAISGRTYNDLAQYPVFPWLLKNYSEDFGKINFNSPEIYRDLSKPIGAMNAERAKNVKDFYNENINETPFHYGSHYSNPGIVTYYLMRLMPYGQLAMDLQGGKFDFSDRLFCGVKETWELVEQSDYKELIPEFYYLPDFLLNLNKFNFGTTSLFNEVNDVILPKWALCNPRHFVMFNRKALESIPISITLNEWIDLIFGYKQIGKPAIEALNVFYILTYEGSVDLQKIESIQEKNGVLDQINEFGQTPRQLFNKPHPHRKKIERSESIFYDPSYLRAMTCLNIMTVIDPLFLEKFKRYKDFYIDKEISGLNFDRVAGLGGFLKVKANKITKEEFISNLSNIRILREGNCLFGNTTKILNYSNYYNQILMFEEKIEKRDNLEIFSLQTNYNDGNILFSSKSKKWLILGTKMGFLYVYKIIKKKENNKSEIASSVHFHHRNSSSSVDTFEDRKRQQKHRVSFRLSNMKKENDMSSKLEKSQDIKGENIEIVLDEKLKFYYPVTRIQFNNSMNITNEKEKPTAFLEKKHVIQDIFHSSQGKNSSLFKKTQTSKFENPRKLANSLNNNESKILVEFVSLLRGHNQQITCIRLYEILLILMTADQEGIVCLWDIEKGTLIIKIYSYHFLDFAIFQEVCFENAEKFLELNNRKSPYNKILSRREGINDLSICDENGDFSIISPSYASIYNINGVLISIIHRKSEKLSRFTSCLLTQNKTRFEDDYLITGHEDGKIVFWVITPNETIPENHLITTSNVYLHNYSKRYQFDTHLIPLIIPYRLIIIHNVKTPLKIRNSDNNTLCLENSPQLPMKTMRKNVNLRQINRIYLSNDQKRMYSLTISGELFQWSYLEFDDKNCETCGNLFGVFDKKTCASCSAFLCSSCYPKFEINIPTKDLKKNDKVCEKCFQNIKLHLNNNCSLYDNY